MFARIAAARPWMSWIWSAGVSGWMPAFGILDARLGSGQLIREQQRERVDGAEHRAGANQRIRERAQPAQHGLHLPADDDAQAVLLDQIGHPRAIRRRQRVLHRFGNQPLPLIPHAGAAVQAGHRFSRHVPLVSRCRSTSANR